MRMILAATLAIAPLLAKDNELCKTAERSRRGVLRDHGDTGQGHPARPAGERPLHRNCPQSEDRGFMVGGKYGKGYLSCRNKSGVGWSAPGTVRIEGGSVGFQIGGSRRT